VFGITGAPILHNCNNVLWMGNFVGKVPLEYLCPRLKQPPASEELASVSGSALR
jgi:hypothetical protein